VKNTNDLLRTNNDQPINNIDVSCVQTVGLKHANGLFVLLETNFFIFEVKCIILDNVIKLFVYFNLCLMLDSLSWSSTSISFLPTRCSFYFNLCLMLDSLSCSSTSVSFLTTNCSFTLICGSKKGYGGR
jgi:hypothetical protein